MGIFTTFGVVAEHRDDIELVIGFKAQIENDRKNSVPHGWPEAFVSRT